MAQTHGNLTFFRGQNNLFQMLDFFWQLVQEQTKSVQVEYRQKRVNRDKNGPKMM